MINKLIAGNTILAALSAATTIYGEEYNMNLVYIFKPLTMVFIIAIALLSPLPITDSYKLLLLIGLLFSLAGDIFLMLPTDKFIAGLISFLIAHLCYIPAFARNLHYFSPWAILPFLFYGLLMLALLWPYLGKLKLSVIVYISAILMMGITACLRWLGPAPTGSFCAFLGALIFISSDTSLAFNKFRGQFRFNNFVILTTYFSAQWLIALSLHQLN